MKSRGTVPVALDTLDASAVANDAKTWEKVVRKMRAGVMPPAGVPRPDKAAHEQFALAGSKASSIAPRREQPNPGRTEPFHRLNRAEYRNAVRDLLDLDVDVAELLPADDASYGFDNIAGVLKMSPTLLERYLVGGAEGQPTGRRHAPPSRQHRLLPRRRRSRRRSSELPGLPFGTRGGASISYIFPMDARVRPSRVRARARLERAGAALRGAAGLEISIDGERVALFTLPGAARACRPAGERARAGKRRRPAPRRTQPESRHRRVRGSDAAATARRARRAIAPTRLGRARAREGRARTSCGDVPRQRTAALDETARLPFLRPYPAGVNIPETRTRCVPAQRRDRGPVRADGCRRHAEPAAHLLCAPATAGE